METYNLKTEYNWRGDVAELLSKFMLDARQTRRTKGYDFKEERFLSSEKNSFLERNWNNIDLYRITDSNRLYVYEVKTRTFGIKGKLDITSSSLRSYKEAVRCGIKAYLLTVTFHENWHVSFSMEKFDARKLRVNDGGWYKKKRGGA